MALSQYGNYYFGAAAAAIGLSLDTALRGAAASQQVQDVDTHTISSFMGSMIDAIVSGTGDNGDDAPQNTRGFNYYDAYTADPLRGVNSDSCNPEHLDNVFNGNLGGSGFSFGEGATWLGGDLFSRECWVCIGILRAGYVDFENYDPNDEEEEDEEDPWASDQ